MHNFSPFPYRNDNTSASLKVESSMSCPKSAPVDVHPSKSNVASGAKMTPNVFYT
jgi:hypothetical protein